MVALQEQELKQQEKAIEKQKNKFIEIVNQKDMELLSEDEDGTSAPASKEVVPNVYDEYDAETGMKIRDGRAQEPPKAASEEPKEVQAAS